MYAFEKEKTQQHKNTNTLTLRGGVRALTAYIIAFAVIFSQIDVNVFSDN